MPRLDDFYREGNDPSLPLVPGASAADWDAPGAWAGRAALNATRDLCTTGHGAGGRAGVRRRGQCAHRWARARPRGARLFVAEGIFAAEIAAHRRELGLLADVLCPRGRPSTTFRRRLIRDVREWRTSLPVLVRRGWQLMREEPGIVRRHVALGAHPCRKREALVPIAVQDRSRRVSA